MYLKYQKITLSFLFILITHILVAQTRKTIVVPLDLDKRTIGDLPFDERFKLSGFDTKYDEIQLKYGLKTDTIKPSYFKGGKLNFTIDKTTNKAFYSGLLGPLHPNREYVFEFLVSKKIELNEAEEKALREEIYKSIKEYFKDAKTNDLVKIDNFKAEVQSLLKKYAGSDDIVNLSGQPIDLTNTPLFQTDLYKVISDIEKDYINLNKQFNSKDPTKNNLVKAKEGANKEIAKLEYVAIFDKIKTALESNDNISESFKGLLDAPINPIPGANEKLTLRQYLDFISTNYLTYIQAIISGQQKIVGNSHEASEKLDSESLKLLAVAFKKLERKSVKDDKGAVYFDTSENKSLGRLSRVIGDIVKEQNAYLKILANLKSGSEHIPNLLRNAIAKKEIKISDEVKIDVLAEKNAYIGLDAGVGFAFGSANGLFTYQGANLYFRPVNHQASFKDLKGWDKFYKRFSIYLGIAQIITDKEDRFTGLLDNSSLLVGIGYRLNRGLRLNVGGLVHYLEDRIPTVDDKNITISPTISLSFDINLIKAIGAVGKGLNLE